MVRAYTIANGTVAVRMREELDTSSAGQRQFAHGDTAMESGVAALPASNSPQEVPDVVLPGKRTLPATNPPSKGRVGAFLDRDGVINNNGWFVNTPDEFELLPGAAAAIRQLNEAGIPVVVVTNQGGVALGHVTEEMVGRIHDRMDELLAAQGAHVDAAYASLAYPGGEIAHLSNESAYRKPQTGMLEQAREDLEIDLSRSTMVGDATTDILAGQRAGCRTILVKTGFAGDDGWAEATPDAVVDDLLAACDMILNDQDSESPSDA